MRKCSVLLLFNKLALIFQFLDINLNTGIFSLKVDKENGSRVNHYSDVTNQCCGDECH